jgi:23S rRNA G2445 N2-methylase RlmL
MTQSQISVLCEAEVAEGLEDFAREELKQVFPRLLRLHPQHERGSVRFTFSGDLRALTKLKTIEAVFLVQPYAIPRPRALLGDANFRLLLHQIEQVRGLHRDQFRTFYLSAAGAHTAVMTRIKLDLAQHSGLHLADDKGDLLLRIKPSSEGGWETLVRLTPRPLVTRSWRVCNFGAALNATIAHVMTLLTQPRALDTFINLGCGSGTLLIERLSARSARYVIGIENNPAVLHCAQENIAASGKQGQIALVRGDMTFTSLPDACADAICADLPFGQQATSHEHNQFLYPRVLDEAARIAKPDARFVLISHEIRLMDRILAATTTWVLEQAIRVTLRGLHPGIYVLRKQL